VAQGPDVGELELPQLLARHGGVTIVDFSTPAASPCAAPWAAASSSCRMRCWPTPAGQPGGVRLLSISFDGAHDDPAALKTYAQGLKAQPGLWRFVRVPDAAQQQVLLRSLGVVVVPDGRGDFEHNAALLVFDARGRMVRVFDLAEQQLALDYARHLARQGEHKDLL
jgi:protein SCO1/2